jgi:hypothetical protein
MPRPSVNAVWLALAFALAIGALCVVAWRWQEACSVSELLDTRLVDVLHEGRNARLVRPFGHTYAILRDDAIFRNMTQRTRLRAVEDSLRCAQRLLGADHRWLLYAGALVGQWRHGALLPHDEDADILVPRPDFLRFRDSLRRLNRRHPPYWYTTDVDKQAWMKLAFKLVHYSDGSDCAVLAQTSDILVARIVKIGTACYTDVWAADIDEQNGTFQFQERPGSRALPLSAIFPVRHQRLGSLTSVPVPNNVTALLETTYGDYQHPFHAQSMLALFTALPSRWLLLPLLLICWLSVTANVRTVAELGFGALCSVLTASSVWNLDCPGTFAPVVFVLALAVAAFHRGVMRRTCPALLLALLCAWSLRTWLALHLDNYRFQDGVKSARLLNLPLFAIDYRSFYDGSQ